MYWVRVCLSSDQVQRGVDAKFVQAFVYVVRGATIRSDIALFREAFPRHGEVVYYCSPGAELEVESLLFTYRAEPCDAPTLGMSLLLVAGDEASAWDLLAR